jgi:hypothetical protein
MSKYLLTCWSDEYVIDANLAEASAPILVDGDSTPYQTADCRHSEDELRRQIAAWLYRDTADSEEAAEEAELEVDDRDEDHRLIDEICGC